MTKTKRTVYFGRFLSFSIFCSKILVLGDLPHLKLFVVGLYLGYLNTDDDGSPFPLKNNKLEKSAKWEFLGIFIFIKILFFHPVQIPQYLPSGS